MNRTLSIAVCLLPAVYFGAIAAYALMHPVDYAGDLVRLLRYVIGPLTIGLLLLSCAVFLARRHSVRIGVHVCAVLAGLFAFEAFLTVDVLSAVHGMVARPGHEAAVDETASLPPSYTWKGVNTVLGTNRLDEAILTNAPYSSVVLCAGGDGPVIYQADRYGFNNPDGVYDRPVTLLVLGDSFVEGLCLTPGTDLVSRIRERVPGTVGMGSRGSGPLYQLALLGRYGPILRPKHTVIAFFAGNDWENLGVEERLTWLRPALESGTAFGPPVPVRSLDAAADVLQDWWRAETPSLYSMVTRTDFARNFLALHQTTVALGLYYPKHHPPRPVFTRILERARAIAATWDGTVSLAFIPVVDRYAGFLPNRFAFDQLRSRVRDGADDAGVPFLDLSAVFDADADPSRFYATDAHFSEEGAIRAADAIAAAGTRREDRVDCSPPDEN